MNNIPQDNAARPSVEAEAASVYTGGQPMQAAHSEKNSTGNHQDPLRPQAKAIPKGGYFELEEGRYGPAFPRTPACYGFSIIAKIKPGREEAFREHAKKLEAAVAAAPDILAPLKLHYLRWLLIPIGNDTYFQYQG